jgi:hypothetical protein
MEQAMSQTIDSTITSRDRVTPVAAFSPANDLFPDVRMSHAALIGALIIEKPAKIVGTYADKVDVDDRAEHVRKVLAAVHGYVGIIIADTADYAHLATHRNGIDQVDLAGILKDAAADVVGAMERAAEGLSP